MLISGPSPSRYASCSMTSRALRRSCVGSIVEPTHERRSARDVMLQLAYRLGLGPEINMAVNSYYKLDGEQMLKPDQTYTIEDISDHELKHKFGPERGLEWFK